jgi:hypothetical protein
MRRDAEREVERAFVRMWVLADGLHLPVKVEVRKGLLKWN